MRSGRLRHGGDPVLEWCVGNVVSRPDRRGSLYRAKQRPQKNVWPTPPASGLATRRRTVRCNVSGPRAKPSATMEMRAARSS